MIEDGTENGDVMMRFKVFTLGSSQTRQIELEKFEYESLAILANKGLLIFEGKGEFDYTFNINLQQTQKAFPKEKIITSET